MVERGSIPSPLQVLHTILEYGASLRSVRTHRCGSMCGWLSPAAGAVLAVNAVSAEIGATCALIRPVAGRDEMKSPSSEENQSG